MNTAGQSIAAGAAWMVGLKLIERSIGFVSTIVLARLLMPADFGLVAMAMALFALLELAGHFGFDIAIIRNRDATRAHYDTAWTLTVCHGLLSGAALAALAAPLAAFFAEPRLEAVVYVLALVAALQGFENVGVMLFRREMQFRKDFNFFLWKKLIAFVCTVSLAVAFRSYWALVAGIAASRAAGVALSYAVHPYRPRPCREKTGELLRFSKWILVNGVLSFLRTRGPDFLIGRLSSASQLGLFRISEELSNLPTTELMHPIMRAAYPGYAKVAHDRDALKRTFLSVQAAVLMVTLPSGVGIIVLAEPFVKLLLGPNWVAAIPLIQVLGLYGIVSVFQSTNRSVFNVLGKPQWNTALSVFELAIVLPLLGALLHAGRPIEVAAWSFPAAAAAALPFAAMLISRCLGLGLAERVRTTWRPVAATAAMGLFLLGAGAAFGAPQAAHDALAMLLVLVPAGAAAYALALLALWQLAGRPDGPERRCLDWVHERAGHLRAWRAGKP